MKANYPTGYITIKYVGHGVFAPYFIGTRNPVVNERVMPLTFASRKEARQYLNDHWPEIKQYN